MNKIIFSPSAWDSYLHWQDQDKKTLRRINQLLKDIQRDSFHGIGKPENLKHRNGWSRRIDDENRLVYDVDENGDILVISCLGHYEN